MIDPFTLLLLAKFAALGIAAIIVGRILFKAIKNWFQKRQPLKESDRDNIGFTIKTELKNGNYNVCQGIFNKRTEELSDAIQWQGKQIDEEFANVHQDKSLVVYN